MYELVKSAISEWPQTVSWITLLALIFVLVTSPIGIVIGFFKWLGKEIYTTQSIRKVRHQVGFSVGGLHN